MPTLADDSLQFKVNRAISVQKITGRVLRFHNQQEEPAIVGDKLQSVGDGIRTKANAKATLALDTGVGTLEMSSDTLLKIQSMQVGPKGGYITRLFLSQGQVRVKLKTFANPESKFEIHTPSSVSGVRGTAFGVAVQPNGNSSIAIESGQVEVIAHERLLLAQGDNAVVPMGKPPLPQPPGIVQPEMSLTWLTPIQSLGQQGTQVRIAGSTNPLNLLRIDDQDFPIGLDGQFDCVLSLPRSRKVSVIITTPLGRQRHYELVVS